MQRRLWAVILLVSPAMALSVAPAGQAAGLCDDQHQELRGNLKWTLQNVVFSASSAIAYRDVDRQLQGEECVVRSVTCVAYAADQSRLEVREGPDGTSSRATYRGLVAFEDGAGQCPSVRFFESRSTLVRTVFEG